MWREGSPSIPLHEENKLGRRRQVFGQCAEQCQEAHKRVQEHAESIQCRSMLSWQQLKEEASDVSDSDTHEEDSHFQFEQGFQFAQLDHQFEPRIRNLFKQAEPKKIKLDLREVMLLDSQSTMDLTATREW